MAGPARSMPGFSNGSVQVAHSWFNRFRKLLVRYEKLERSFVALHHLAAAIIVFRKIPMKSILFTDRFLFAAKRQLVNKRQIITVKIYCVSTSHVSGRGASGGLPQSGAFRAHRLACLSPPDAVGIQRAYHKQR
jgi:hypothetical protein